PARGAARKRAEADEEVVRSTREPARGDRLHAPWRPVRLSGGLPLAQLDAESERLELRRRRRREQRAPRRRLFRRRAARRIHADGLALRRQLERAMRARTPWTKELESSVENSFASSTASSIATAVGTSSLCSSSHTPMRRIARST